MEKVNFIIEHLKNNPFMRKLKKSDCFNELIKLLPPELRNGVKFIYEKDNTIFFVLTHSAYKMTFDNSLKNIKSLLNTVSNLKKDYEFLKNKEIKAFLSYTVETFQEPKNENLNTYTEKSSGNFINEAKDTEIFEIFEKIRKAIKNTKQC